MNQDLLPLRKAGKQEESRFLVRQSSIPHFREKPRSLAKTLRSPRIIDFHSLRSLRLCERLKPFSRQDAKIAKDYSSSSSLFTVRVVPSFMSAPPKLSKYPSLSPVSRRYVSSCFLWALFTFCIDLSSRMTLPSMMSARNPSSNLMPQYSISNGNLTFHCPGGVVAEEGLTTPPKPRCLSTWANATS